MRSSAAPAVIGVIRAGESYTLREFRSRVGLRDFALREARKQGLRVIAVGRKRYVLGSDWIAFLEGQATATETSD